MGPDDTEQKQNAALWKPGQSGNPAGRPKGARSKLGEDFLQSLYQDWQEHGAAVIQAVRQGKPHEYLRLVASLLPRQIELRTDPFREVSDEELTAMVEWVKRQLAGGDVPEVGDVTTH